MVGIWKGVGKLDGRVLIGLEEEGKFEAVCFFVVLCLVAGLVADAGASSSPFGGFFIISIADFHAFVEETTFFGESFDGEVSLSFDSFYCEVEP